MSFFSSPLGVQSATVVDNKDPDQMGRVKVNFPWDENSVQSAWASVVQSMAGNAYGTYFLPEVGDTVLVGFLNNNHDTPIVIGGIYTGQGKQADCYDADNYIKNIKTKAGNEVKFYDKKGEESIQITNTENGNEILFNMKDKSITISSPNEIQLNAPKILLKGTIINLTGGDVKIHATSSYTDMGGNNWESDGDLVISTDKDMRAHTTGTATIFAEKDASITGGQSLSLHSNSDVKLSGMNIQGSANVGITMKGAATAELSASGQTTVKGAIVMIN